MNIKVYQSGLKFMVLNTVKRLYDGEVLFKHSLDHGIVFRVYTKNNTIIERNDALKIKKYMDHMVEKNIPFNKKVVKKEDAVKFYKSKDEFEKESNVLDISNSTVTLFELEGRYNYFYTNHMPKSTGELKNFDIFYIEPNLMVLVYPFPLEQDIKYTFREKIYNTFKEYRAWNERINIKSVFDINKTIAAGAIQDLIMKNDIKNDTDLFRVGDAIIKGNKKIVLIAGPSSSGKTTTSKKLSLYLTSMGYRAIPISLDDFFLDLEYTPLLENGEKDFESINALDLKLFNEKLSSLINGNSESLPTYNFILGKKEYKKSEIKIEENDILVIEGLHGINPNLLNNSISEDLIYKIYVSPLIPLNVDRHNYLSSTDNRLLRRMVRDFKTRGRSAEDTLASWDSVRKGEEEYIFPYTDTVDTVLNTGFIYEIGVLKVFVEPLLYRIKMDSPYYNEARRLLDNLRVFYPISSEYINSYSVLREFIGNGINWEG